MPYIESKSNRRKELQDGDCAKIAGELNYQIFYNTKHNYEYCKQNNKSVYFINYIESLVGNFLGDKPNYQRYNDMVGCLLLCAKEIRRRLHIDLSKEFKKIIDSYDYVIAKYEDKKIKENGDVR